MNWAVVVPTCRPERFGVFLDAWRELFDRYGVKLFVLQDTNEPFDFDYEAKAYHRGNVPDFIPIGTDMIRSWGIYQAWKAGSDYTLSLDDDVLPEGDLFDAYERVFRRGAPLSDYLDVGALTTSGKQMRGFPFRDRQAKTVVVQYGGWHGVLDYDAPTQIAGVNKEEWFENSIVPVPRGVAATGCIMNAAWRTEYASIMWQLPMLVGRYNRFGDIWAGLFAKKTLDALGAVMVVNGEAIVRHKRASDPVANLVREAPGIPLNEDIWQNLEGNDYRSVTDSAAQFFQKRDPAYAKHFRSARDEWLALFA
jgi:hypothetical protein